MITKAEIAKLFEKQLAQIDDPGLRDKVVEVWLVGCERGGWDSLDELKKMPFTLLTDTKGVTFIEHSIAVTEGAVGLAKAQIDAYKNVPYKIDMDRLIAAGLLHDVGKLMEIEPDGAGGYRKSHSGRCARHPISGAIITAEAGLSEEIVNAIICHAKEGEGRPQVIEAVLVHQADFATFDPLVMMKKGDLIQ
jgi:putative nucleotidyltransferase with HDIG domain